MEIYIKELAPHELGLFLEVDQETTWENLPLDDQKRLGEESFVQKYRALMDNLLQEKSSKIFVAKNQAEEILGFLWVGQKKNVFTHESEGWIYGLSVLKNFRKQGISKKLVAFGEEYFKKLGLKAMGLNVACHNEIAQGVYRRAGFSPNNLTMRKLL